MKYCINATVSISSDPSPLHISMMEDCMDNEKIWPRKDDDKKPLWYHSDWKQLAYSFVYKLFDKISKNDGGKN